MKTDRLRRCAWCEGSALYVRYHDEEWGVPVHDDRVLFEMLTLESFQSGLSWLTVLQKREAFRVAFDDFDVVKVAAYGEDKIDALLRNSGIIRHKGKIEACINNAQGVLAIQAQEGSFDQWLWAYVNHQSVVGYWRELAALPTRSVLSDRLSKDLKKRGFKYLGSTTVYSYMQAVGMLNDHLISCPCFPSACC